MSEGTQTTGPAYPAKSPREILSEIGLINDDDRLLSIDEWCAVSGMSRRQFYREVNAGRLKVRERGGRKRVRLGDHREYVATHWVEQTEPTAA